MLADGRTGLQIIDEMEHISPHVVFDDSPISYLQDGGFAGLGHRFFEGQGRDGSVECYDPSKLTYQVITIGGRLIGKIDCSDVFGVDIDLDKFIERIQRQSVDGGSQLGASILQGQSKLSFNKSLINDMSNLAAARAQQRIIENNSEAR